MFGYITTNIPELKVKDYQTYQSYYCGLCQTLKKYYGRTGQLTLSYDLTFFVLLLTGLYEPETETKAERCILHPLSKHPRSINQYSKYAADMNILLTYYKLLDDWVDEKKYLRYIGARFLSPKYRRIRKEYPEKCEIFQDCMNQISACEKNNEENLDAAAGHFGRAFAELFTYRNDEWEEILRRMGFYFGKFIYLMDAYEDLEQDKKTGNYNPFLHICDSPSFEEQSRQILTMMMTECALEFEKLPILEHADILRNILYSGVWARYGRIHTDGKE